MVPHKDSAQKRADRIQAFTEELAERARIDEQEARGERDQSPCATRWSCIMVPPLSRG